MRLVHISDPHLTRPPAWRTLAGRSAFGKRYLGYLSWARKRRHQLRREWLDELTQELTALDVDQVVISGDLTQLGTAEEITAARGWLDALAKPERVFLVPGNHDAYARDSWALLRRTWSPYLPADGAAGFPVVRRVGEVLLVGLNSALPTAPLSAAGALGSAQLERLDAVLSAGDTALRVLVVHHPPLPGMISHRKRLRDAARLAERLSAGRVALVLHGHRHLNQASVHGDMKVFCTAPASARSAMLRIFDVTATPSGWRLAMTCRERADAGFETVETLAWELSAPGPAPAAPAPG